MGRKIRTGALLIMTGVVLCRRKKDSAKEEQADEE